MNARFLLVTGLFFFSSLTSVSAQAEPRWNRYPAISPDGATIVFTYRGDLYRVPAGGGRALALTSHPAHDFMPVWSGDGTQIAFASNRHGNFDIYVMPATGGSPWDITPGDFDTPPISLGSHQDFCFSPDGREIAFVRKTYPNTAISTNNNIFVASSRGGTIRRITDNPANDNQPSYSPDGRYIAYRAMSKPGFEADQYDLMLYDRKTSQHRSLTDEFDLDVG